MTARILRKVVGLANAHRRGRRRQIVYEKYREYTMVPDYIYTANLALAERVDGLPGAVVECGVWRGGMIAGLAEVLGPAREYVLCDSFEGLPPAREIDGPAAQAWQANKTSPAYYDNCAAGEEYARRAMSESPAERVRYVSGWFEHTLPNLALPNGIAVLRLDGDWYDSTMLCLRTLVPQVVPGGVIIIDDYYTWDGCSRAVHDYLAAEKLPLRIRQWNNQVCYLSKTTAE